MARPSITATLPAVASVAASLALVYVPFFVKDYYILRSGLGYDNVSPVRAHVPGRTPPAQRATIGT